MTNGCMCSGVACAKLKRSSVPIIPREDKKPVWGAQRQPPGRHRVRPTRTPTPCGPVRPHVWPERSLRAHAVPWQHGAVLVRRPQRTGDPRVSLQAWKQANVWVNHMVIGEHTAQLCVSRKNNWEVCLFGQAPRQRTTIFTFICV